MKKCPYCAEEIQDAAVVCRYCGRNLPALTKSTDGPVTTIPLSSTPPKTSFWSRGATKASVVITILYVIYQLITPLSSGELIYRLTIGLAVTFAFWWLICACLAWLWKKVGGVACVVGVIAIGIIGVVIALDLESKGAGNTVSAPSQTTAPMVVPTLTTMQQALQVMASQAPTPPLSAVWSGECLPWDKFDNPRKGTTICVYGAILYRTTFPNRSDEILRFARDTHLLYVYTPKPFEGDCVVAVGVITPDIDGGTLVFADHAYQCP